MNREALNRRRFLRAVGASAVALPFFKLLETSAVEAQTLPLRFIGVYTPHGVAKELWRPGANFDIAYADAALAPFDDAATYGESFKSRLAVIEGVDLAGIESGTTGHDASRSILTGEGQSGTSPSLDQFLAVEQGLGAETRFQSLVLGVGHDGSELGWNISYAAGGAPLPKIIDPTETFNTVFADLVATTDPAQAAAAEAARRKGQSVIDYVRGDLNRLRGRLAPVEQQKLDQHLNAVRELEKRLEDFSGSCTLPSAPDSAQYPNLRAYNGGEPYFDVITDLQIDMIASAMACDVTRFATLFMNDLSRTNLDPSLPDDIHNSVAHVYDGSSDDAAGNPSTWLPLAKQNRYSYGKVARLMQRLSEYGVLDDTIIYASSDMGNPNLHSSRNVPTVLAGGAGGKFNMGRFIQLTADCPPGNQYCSSPSFVYNNRILVSIAQAFGVDIDTYGTGTPGGVSGGLSELTTT